MILSIKIIGQKLANLINWSIPYQFRKKVFDILANSSGKKIILKYAIIEEIKAFNKNLNFFKKLKDQQILDFYLITYN